MVFSLTLKITLMSSSFTPITPFSRKCTHSWQRAKERSRPVIREQGIRAIEIAQAWTFNGGCVGGETMKAKGLNFLSRDDLAAEAVLVCSVVVDCGQNDCNIVFLSSHHPLEAGSTRILGEGRKKVLVP